MSVRIMTRVFDKSKQKGTNRLALLCIGDNAHDDGVAFPGITEIARKMGGVSRRSAGRRIEALAKTTELGVYPRTGGSHDFIVFTGMTLTEARTAIRKMLNKRRMTIVELHNLRRMFAGKKPGSTPKVSRVPAAQESQGVRRQSRTNRQEPSVEPPPAGGDDKGEKKERPQDEVFNAVAAGSFNILDISKVNGDGGRIAKISTWLKKLTPPPPPDRIRLFYTRYKREHKDINPPRDLEKFQEHWAEFEQSPEGKAEVKPADGKPVNPLLALGISQAELDANPGLQADLERVYREQGKIK